MSLLPKQNPVQAIAWMVGTTFFSACGAAQARHLSQIFPPVEVVCFTMIGAALWMLPWMIRHGLKRLKTRCWKRYAARAMLELAGWSLAYHALLLLPLPTYTAITFLQPLLLSTAAVIVLGERSTRHTWIALAVGFIGMYIILKPDVSGYAEGAAFVVLAVTCFSACGLIIKTLTRTELPPVITFYMLSLTGIAALPFALPIWHAPVPHDLPWIVLIGLTMTGTQTCVSHAISRAPLTTIMPFSFCALIFSSVLAYLFFGEVVTPWTIAGGAVILASAFYSLYHTRRATRREQQGIKP